MAVKGAAAPAPQAHLPAPYRPRYSLDQRTAGQYLGGLGTPGDGHVPARCPRAPLQVHVWAPLPAWRRAGPADPEGPGEARDFGRHP